MDHTEEEEGVPDVAASFALSPSFGARENAEVVAIPDKLHWEQRAG